jgi:putative ATP-binding cassette transporter
MTSVPAGGGQAGTDEPASAPSRGVVAALRAYFSLRPGAGPRLVLSALCGAGAALCTGGVIALLHQRIASGAEVPVALLVFLIVVQPALGVGSEVVLTTLREDLLLATRLRLARRLLSTQLPNVERLDPGRLLAAFTQVVSKLADATGVIPGVIYRFTLVGGLYGYLAWHSLSLFLGLLLLVAAGALGYVAPVVWHLRAQRRTLRAQEEHLGVFHDLVGGTPELLQSSAKRSEMEVGVTESGASLHGARWREALIGATAGHLQDLYALLALTALVLWVAPVGETPPIEVASFLFLVVFSLKPLTSLAHKCLRLGEIAIALEELEALGVSLGSGEEQDAPPLPTSPTITLRGVEFERTEQGETFHLGPIDLELSSPSVVFLTGGNGSGKSTLLRVLCGLYPPSAGELRVEGSPVAPGDAAYRDLFSGVRFDFHLFQQLLGVPPERASLAGRLLERLGLGAKVSVSEGRFSTTRLSQGQRRRLAMVCTLLEDRPVVVFDEWAADQDAEHKRMFYRELLPELRESGKLVVVVTHDERFFDAADRVLCLAEGKLIGER